MFAKDIADIIKIVKAIVAYAENPTIRNDFVEVIQALDPTAYAEFVKVFDGFTSNMPGIFERIYCVIRSIKDENPVAYHQLIKEFESFV